MDTKKLNTQKPRDEDIGIILNAYAQDEIPQSVALKRLGTSDRVELLILLAEYGLTPPTHISTGFHRLIGPLLSNIQHANPLKFVDIDKNLIG